MYKQKDFEYIINTYICGNITHAFLRINDYGVYDFVCELEMDDSLDVESKYELLTKYLRFVHRK